MAKTSGPDAQFKAAHQRAQNQRHAEIQQKQHRIDRRAVLSEIAQLLGAKSHVAQTDERNERRILEVLHRQIAEWGHHFRHRLRYLHAHQSLKGREVERARCLKLALLHRLKRATHHLGTVGSDVEAEREHARKNWRQAQINADRLPGQW